ncbi:MAG: DUF4397 domain-containing protein [Candidatus Sulfotelmatobacter sp.]|jgi:hypothetical protein
MTTPLRYTLALALLCAALVTGAHASSMYIVQGIAGRNYAAATDPAFPVDILLNDEVCYVHGLAFGSITGPLTFLPGTYNVKVSIADSLAPCSKAPLIDQSVDIDAKTDYSAVLTLNDDGTPKLLTFTNNLTPVVANTGRLLFALGANSPAVQVILENTATKKLYVYAVKPGALLDVTLPSGDYTVEINQGTTTLAASTLGLDSQSVDLLYAIGQASNNTVVLETRTLRDVI